MGLIEDEKFWETTSYNEYSTKDIDFNTASISSPIKPDRFMIETDLLSLLYANVRYDKRFMEQSFGIAEMILDERKVDKESRLHIRGNLIQQIQKNRFYANLKELEDTINSELKDVKISKNMIDDALEKIYNNFTNIPYSHKDIKEFEFRIDGARNIIANLLNVKEASINFGTNCESTLTDLLRHAGIKKGDEIIISSEEYDGVIDVVKGIPYHKDMTWPIGSEWLWEKGFIKYPLIEGLNVKIIDSSDLMKNLKKSLTKKTKAVILSHITHETCNELPVEEASKIIKQGDAYFFLDIAQSLGQKEIDLGKISPDAAFGSGQKWLRGLNTSNVYYLGERMKGYFNYEVCHLGNANRDYGFDVSYMHDGEGNLIQLLSLSKSIAVLDKIGWKNSFERIKFLGDYARGVFSENDCVDLKNPDNPAPGMIPIRVIDQNQEDVKELLGSLYKIKVTYKQGNDSLRISTSQFNTTYEIDVLSKAIENIAKYGKDALKH